MHYTIRKFLLSLFLCLGATIKQNKKVTWTWSLWYHNNQSDNWEASKWLVAQIVQMEKKRNNAQLEQDAVGNTDFIMYSKLHVI